MSGKIDPSKELMHSFEDGLFKTLGLIGMGYALGNSKPTLTPNLKNVAILTVTIAGMDIVYDYAKAKKWLPWS